VDGILRESIIFPNAKPTRLEFPFGVVTLTLPLAPVPTTAVMVVLLKTLKLVAATPPKLTAVAPVKLVPVKVTVNPLAAVAGLKELRTGACAKLFVGWNRDSNILIANKESMCVLIGHEFSYSTDIQKVK
jgi:hypothetical protein